MARSDEINAQAIAWRIRLADAGAAEWEAFIQWLESDPEHARAYDEVAQAEADAAQAMAAVPMPAAANDDAPRPSHRRWIGFGAATAAIALGFVAMPLLRSTDYAVETAPGEQRRIALADGTQIVLNGATRIELDKGDPRFAMLDRGQASFAVVHDAGSPFRVKVGDAVVQDVGTRFEVTRSGSDNRVEVAEGAVRYNPDRENVPLRAGQTLVDPHGDTPIQVGHRNVEAIGGWTNGRLSYDQEPIARVAADLAQTLGVRIEVAPELSARRFSGTIKLGRDRPLTLVRAAQLLDASARRTTSGWRFEPARDEAR